MKLNKKVATIVSLALLGTATIAGTVAYLFTSAGPVTNTFAPASVTSEVDEDFDGNVKSNVTIQNTGNVKAYIRAKVVVTWQNKAGDVLAQQPVADTDYKIEFVKGSWLTSQQLGMQDGGYYYYNAVVDPDGKTSALIKTAKPLKAAPVDGYFLSVEIIAEAIQAEGSDGNKTPIQLAWKAN